MIFCPITMYIHAKYGNKKYNDLLSYYNEQQWALSKYRNEVDKLKLSYHKTWFFSLLIPLTFITF